MSGEFFEAIELELLDDDSGEVVLGEPRPTRRWSPVLVGGLRVGGRGRGRTRRPQRRWQLGAATTVPAAEPVTAPTTSIPPTTDTPRPTRPSFTDHVAFVNLLGVPSGTSLYGVTDDGNVVRIDLDAGRVSERRLRRGDRGQPPVTVFGQSGQAVVASQDQALVVGDGADGVVTFLAAATTAVLPAAGEDEVWLVRSLDAGRLAERRNVTNGSVTGTIYNLPEGSVLGDDGSGALLMQTGSGVYRFDGTGQHPAPVSTDALVAWSATTFVAKRCDDQFQCQWQLIDRASAEERPMGAAPWGGSVLGAELSPDGSHLAYVGGLGGPVAPSLEVMDVATGARLILDQSAVLSSVQGTSRGLVWSADGQWLFWVNNAGALRAWHVGEPQPITVDGAGQVPSLEAIGLAR